jgi:hypothetical protein
MFVFLSVCLLALLCEHVRASFFTAEWLANARVGSEGGGIECAAVSVYYSTTHKLNGVISLHIYSARLSLQLWNN